MSNVNGHIAHPQLVHVDSERASKWRGWGVPDQIIRKALAQTRQATLKREREERIAVNGFAYTMPRLPEIEAQRWGFAKAIDADGSVDPHGFYGRDKIEKIDRWRYRYEYRRPRVVFYSHTYDFAEEIANMMHTAVRVARVFDHLTKAYVIRYGAVAWTSRAVRICYLIERHLAVPAKRERAREILTTYRETPSIRL